MAKKKKAIKKGGDGKYVKKTPKSETTPKKKAVRKIPLSNPFNLLNEAGYLKSNSSNRKKTSSKLRAEIVASNKRQKANSTISKSYVSKSNKRKSNELARRNEIAYNKLSRATQDKTDPKLVFGKIAKKAYQGKKKAKKKVVKKQ